MMVSKIINPGIDFYIREAETENFIRRKMGLQKPISTRLERYILREITDPRCW